MHLVSKEKLFVFTLFPQDDLSEWLICHLDAEREVVSVAASDHYVVIIYGHKSVFYQSTESNFQAMNWLPIKTPASQIAVSSSGHHLWRLYEGTAYQGVNVSSYHPKTKEWTAVDKEVSSIGIVQMVIGDQ